MKQAGDVVRRNQYRTGKVHLGGWVHPDFRRSVRLVQAQTDESFDRMLERALNKVFREHGVPTVDPVTGAEKLPTIKETNTAA
jgi:antitoxin-like ribbon-helix-helix protein